MSDLPAPAIDQLEVLLEKLPDWVQQHVLDHQDGVEDVVLEVGRPLRFNLMRGYKRFDQAVTKDELEHLKFAFRDVAADNRTGLDGTLHRISVIRRRARGAEGVIIGATVRVARVVVGVAEVLRPYLLSGNPMLMGPPKTGKTSLLRDLVRIKAEVMGPRLVVVDTSNEIAGFGDVPHPIIGDARRLQVPGPEHQARVITEAIANHSAEMIVLDEVKRVEDALELEAGSKTGVGFAATVHAWTFDEALENTKLAPLFGNVNLQRRRKPTRTSFSTIVEIKGRGRFVVHEDADGAIKRHLEGKPLEGIRVGAW